MLQGAWRNPLRSPYVYNVGNKNFRSKKQMIISALVFLMLTFIYMHTSLYTSIHRSICSQPIESSVPLCYFYKYNRTYPMTRPVETSDSISYRIAIISDLDERSKDSQDNLWHSILKKGYLVWIPLTNALSVSWDDQDIILSSSLAMNGRGMEFSELVTFDGRLLTFDDRTGVIYSVTESKIYPWVILMDGNGKSPKGSSNTLILYRRNF